MYLRLDITIPYDGRMTNCHVFNAERVNLSTALAILLKPHTILPKPAKIGYSLQKDRGESLDCMWHAQTHSIFSPIPQGPG